MDALSATLRVVHLVGAIFINARFTAHGVTSRQRQRVRPRSSNQVLTDWFIFHLVTEGECYAEIAGQPPVRLTAGEIVIFPKGMRTE